MTDKKIELSQIVNETKIKLNKDGTPAKKRGRKPKDESVKPEVLPPRETGLKPAFKSLYQFFGNILVTTTQHDDFKISEDESETLTIQTENVMIEFMPEVGMKWAKLGILITTILAIFGKKFLSYELKKKKEKESIKDTNPSKKEPTNNLIEIDPNNY